MSLNLFLSYTRTMLSVCSFEKIRGHFTTTYCPLVTVILPGVSVNLVILDHVFIVFLIYLLDFFFETVGSRPRDNEKMRETNKDRSSKEVNQGRFQEEELDKTDGFQTKRTFHILRQYAIVPY